MLSNYEEKVASTQEIFDKILKSISGDLQNKEIHEVEEKLYRSVLELGHSILKDYLEEKGTGKDSQVDLPYHKTETWNYISIFGDLKISNAYFWEKGNKGISPLKKELNLPNRHFSYLLQKWSQMFCVSMSHEKARENIKEILGIDIWSGQTESINKSASESVDSFYQHRENLEQKEPILVVQVDGKGIVMRENLKKETHGTRLKKGEKNGKKKMSTVTAVYGIEQHVRSVEDIIRRETECKTRSVVVLDKKKGVIPQNKVVRATLKGKESAFEHLAKETALRDPEGKKDHIALMDGEKALANNTKKYLPGFTIILDLFHVMERLWTLSYFFHDEGSDEALYWVRKYLKMFLKGKVGYAIGGIRQSAKKKGLTSIKIKAMEKHLRYFETKKEYMKYDGYLKKGYPIGSGVIEGTCRSLVNDRMELSGMHWSESGAEAMLELRSIRMNGFWNKYWKYHVSEQKESIYEWDSVA